ncbi:hypothetical protein HK405_014098 [Cladochytrium tenue]|nr:hypothetical protein HK405_014098 [Cladochytrium tenue]
MTLTHEAAKPTGAPADAAAGAKIPVVFLSRYTLELWVAGVREAMAEAAPELELIYPLPADLDRSRVTVAITGTPPHGALAEFPNLKLIANMWAGVDAVLADPSLPRAPALVRLVDPCLTSSMVETALMHVLNVHRDFFSFTELQRRGVWNKYPNGMPVAAADRCVVVFGAGELGVACVRALAGLGFRVRGWSRSPKPVDPELTGAGGADVCMLAGAAGFDEALREGHIFINLLPLTPETESLFSRDVFLRMPRGASFINLGRGRSVNEDDLLQVLDEEHLAYAILDVFRVEPLPEESRLWSHPRCIVMPHVAATPNPKSASRIVVQTIKKHLAGETDLVGLVDRDRGY